MSSATLEFAGQQRRRIITAASAGNFAEWYDWGVYGVVATVIAAKFFPSGDSAVALLNTYAVFALGYLSRPFGGLIFGWIGDKLGRRRALSLTIVLTCGGTALIGVLPTYAQVGVLAPALLLICRLVQSIGTGGEYSSAISFVYEHSPVRRRGRNVAMLLATTFIGISIGSVLARVLSQVMSDQAYQTYGWRILFLVALPLAILGIYLRSHVEETPEFRQIAAARQAANRQATPVQDALRSQWPAMIAFVVATASYALISSTITSYLTTFLTNVNDLTKSQAYNVTIISNVVLIITTIAMGPVFDRLGLRKTLMAAAAAVAVLGIPALALAAHGLAGGTVGGMVIGLCKGLLAVPALLAISQIYPGSMRVTAGALAYNVSQSVFGGTGPVIGVWLNHSTGGPYGFGIYLATLAVITVIAVYVARSVFDRSYHADTDVAAVTPAALEVR